MALFLWSFMVIGQSSMPPPGNRLAGSHSPYLRQHAHNPVHWLPWSEEAWAQARRENKLVLLSIGYSSCHWCHVMERESFEDPEVAAVMNARYICIKVDREERPDVDQVYMNAVQLMTGRGGWPLNCFALPDGRPVHGGTYYPRAGWLQLLADLDGLWRSDPDRVAAQADAVHDGLRRWMDPGPVNTGTTPGREVLERMIERAETGFDAVFGGPDRAPKFPLPSYHGFLLRYGHLKGDGTLLRHLRLTLDRMAQGGLFDQVGGGFARYSVDARWKVPHFEKMLYDNAQLIALYCDGYKVFRDEAYRDVVERTIGFVERELTDANGGFMSALDADSEGEEGRYYVWTIDELSRVLGDDLAFARAYYCVDERGHWEEGRHILLRDGDDADHIARHGGTLEGVRLQRERVDRLLLAAREARVRPPLDDKCITAWNAMMISALCQAHDAFGEQRYLDMAARAMQHLLAVCLHPDGGVLHDQRRGEEPLRGFLDDHAFLLQALVDLYTSTFDERWLERARVLTGVTIERFHDPAHARFHFTDHRVAALIVRPAEMRDNVIPASNSVMARVLSALGELVGVEAWIDMARSMLRPVMDQLPGDPEGHGNWGLLLMEQVLPWYSVAITGPGAGMLRAGLAEHLLPVRLVGSTVRSTLPLLEDKPMDNDAIHICEGRTCRLPVRTVEEALAALR